MSYNNGAKIVTDGLVLCFDVGNTKSYTISGSVLNDLSRRGHDSSITGSIQYDERFAGGLIFTGSDYISVAHDDQLSCGVSGSLTVEAVFITPNHTQNGAIFTKRLTDSSTNTDYMLFYSTSGPNITWGTGPSGDSVAWMSSTEFNYDNTPMYFCGTIDGINNFKTLYKNGNLLSSGTFSLKATANSNPLYVGKYYGAGYYFQGSIFLLRIYNRALSATEVLKNYNGFKKRFSLP